MFTKAKALAASQTNMLPFVFAGIFYYVLNLIVAFFDGTSGKETELLSLGTRKEKRV